MSDVKDRDPRQQSKLSPEEQAAADRKILALRAAFGTEPGAEALADILSDLCVFKQLMNAGEVSLHNYGMQLINRLGFTRRQLMAEFARWLLSLPPDLVQAAPSKTRERRAKRFGSREGE